MADPRDPPRPVQPIDGFLPLEDYGLIGDGRTAALVGRDGSIGWLCVPRFDSPPLLCGLLDRERGGTFTVAPDALVASRQRYQPDTGVLVAEMQAPTGALEVIDLFALRTGANLREGSPASRGELLRTVHVLNGTVDVRVTLRLRGRPRVERHGGGWRLRLPDRPDLDLHVFCSAPLDDLDSTIRLVAGERLHVLLRWARGARAGALIDQQTLTDDTARTWQAWADEIEYDGPQRDLVHRSAITLKLLDHWENGAIVAAPTSSLPEAIGGPRNWDYRYTWVRDAAFSVYALRQIGLNQEAARFLGWVLDAIEREGEPRILYDLDGQQPPPESIDPELVGYRRSQPVRWGNAAADQVQHDVYGEILDCAYQWIRGGQRIDAALWQRLQDLAEMAARRWRTPDHGIWEIRAPGRPFTYSVALCAVALDRAARIAAALHLPDVADRWTRQAQQIRAALLREAWSDELGSLTEHLGDPGLSTSEGRGLDGSLLTLPLRRILPADDPRMVATTRAVVDRLGAGQGLLYRYLPEESPDGLPGHEGAFLLCSFWLVDNLAGQGRLEEAGCLYDDLCGRASPLGLLPEQIDPGTGAFLGNYPQAFSSIGVISSGVTLARAFSRSSA
jgi:alpha,alpha-trehalase